MKGSEKTIEEVSKLISEAIFSESIVDKKDINEKIQILIKAFVKQQNKPKQNRSNLKEQDYINVAHRCNLEKRFWQRNIKTLITPEKYMELCNELTIELEG